MTSIGNLFAHLHPSTSGLSSDVLNKTTEFIYCFRDGVESVCLVTEDKETLKSLIGDLPTEIYDTNRYAVDLSTIGTNKVRLYLNSKSNDEYIIGYYFSNSNAVLQKKLYKKDNTVNSLIDRYESNGDLISENEAEVSGVKSDWGGDSSLADSLENVASQNNVSIFYSKRNGKNQNYISVSY